MNWRAIVAPVVLGCTHFVLFSITFLLVLKLDRCCDFSWFDWLFQGDPYIRSQKSGNAINSLANCQKLKGDLLEVFNMLPTDMQQLLLMNPQRAALLQGWGEVVGGVISSTSPR